MEMITKFVSKAKQIGFTESTAGFSTYTLPSDPVRPYRHWRGTCPAYRQYAQAETEWGYMVWFGKIDDHKAEILAAMSEIGVAVEFMYCEESGEPDYDED